jgi:hypothetical protein
MISILQTYYQTSGYPITSAGLSAVPISAAPSTYLTSGTYVEGDQSYVYWHSTIYVSGTN